MGEVVCGFFSDNESLMGFQRGLGESNATPKTSGMAPWLVLPATLSMETGFETQFAAMAPIAPQRPLPRARAAQTSTLTWGFVVLGIPHRTGTCGRLGEAKATPKTREAQAALTHTRTQFNQKSTIATKYQIDQIQ